MNTHRAVAEEFARRIVSILGDQVESVILYGSVARGEAVPESDIDILVIGDDSCHLRDVTSEIAFDIDREGAFTFLISPFTIEHDKLLNLKRLGSPFIHNVLKEGQTLYDNETLTGIHHMTTGPTPEYISKQLESADQALDDAEFLLKNGRYNAAVNRAYYAMFYAALAALMKSGGELPRTHSGVRNQLGLRYVTTGIIEPELAKTLQGTYELRRRSDYELYTSFTEDEIEQAVQNARTFVTEVRRVTGL